MKVLILVASLILAATCYFEYLAYNQGASWLELGILGVVISTELFTIFLMVVYMSKPDLTKRSKQ